jgi:hypothetical protein
VSTGQAIPWPRTQSDVNAETDRALHISNGVVLEPDGDDELDEQRLSDCREAAALACGAGQTATGEPRLAEEQSLTHCHVFDRADVLAFSERVTAGALRLEQDGWSRIRVPRSGAMVMARNGHVDKTDLLDGFAEHCAIF